MQHTASTPLRPTLSIIILYALGQFGWSLASYCAANLLTYFYMPAGEDGKTMFPIFIFQGAIFGLLTLVGLAGFAGRIFDAITDPLVANYSDKMDSAFGKRKKLMAIGVLPFALFSFLVFYPLTDAASTLNSVWLFFTILVFFLFMTIYTIPYTALIAELGHHPDDRLLISTVISVTWALGFLLGSNVYAIQGIFEKSYDATTAFQITVGGFSLLAFALMLIPILFVNEKKYCRQSITDQPIMEALRGIFKNQNFKTFLASDLLYWLSLTFIQQGISYYVLLLFGLEKEMATAFLAIGFLGSFLLYVPINLLVKKIGKKKVLNSAFAVFSVIFLATAMLDYLPLSKQVWFYLLAATSGYSLAAFGIIPNAIVADIVYEHESKTGLQQSGLFFAVRNFTMKLGVSLANLVFPSLLLLGKSSENSTGVWVTTICALVFCIVGYVIFLRYKDVVTK